MNKKSLVLENLIDRQDVINNVAGFIAPNHRELSEALAILGTRETIGVAQHLHEIYRRQIKSRTERPENAVKAVTREYITGYRSSQAILRHLGYLAVDINQICNPNIFLSDEYQKINHGHRALVRFDDLNKALNVNVAELSLNESMKRHYFSKDTESTEYIINRLSEIKVREARGLIKRSIEDQQNRSIFWKKTITDLSAHRIAGPVIRSSLVLAK